MKKNQNLLIIIISISIMGGVFLFLHKNYKKNIIHFDRIYDSNILDINKRAIPLALTSLAVQIRNFY